MRKNSDIGLVKLLGNKNLKELKTEKSTIYSWWRLSGFDIILIFFSVIHCIWGIASFNGAVEIIGIKVIPMNDVASSLYWGGLVIVLIHLIFNRKTKLIISSTELIYRRGLGFGNRTLMINEISAVQIKTIKEHIAEAPVDRDLTTYHLHIIPDKGKAIRIKSLSKADLQTIQETITQYRSA
jgi:hypothetical protein